MLREFPSHVLFTVLMLVCLIAIAMAKSMAPKRFNDFIMVIGNSKYLKIYGKDQKFLDYYDGFLFLNLVISLGIFIVVCLQGFTGEANTDTTLVFKIILGSGVFILAKVLLERLIGSLFKIDALIDDYMFQKISYKNYLGLLLLPVNAILIFSLTPSLQIIYCVFALLFIVNFSGLVTTFKAYQNEIKGNLFYFILYLCALEIAPYIIIYSIFVTK